MDRRNFVATVAAGAALAPSRVIGANDRIRVGLIGTGGRCQGLGRLVLAVGGAEIVAACDVYAPRREEAAAKMGTGVKPVADYRRVLDDKSIDAVVIGSPDHWHVQMTLDAVAAGKDVYVEKPVTHKIEEGEKLILGVEKSGRVVATGTQQRAWEHFQLAKQLIGAGRLGKVVFVQTYWYQNYFRRGPAKDGIDASKLDWKAWLGPAPDQPFDTNKYRQWRFFWDFGGGSFTDLMTHWIDTVQWIMGVFEPVRVTAAGTNHLNTWLECPDTVTATLLYGRGFTATYDSSLVSSVEDGGIILRGTDGVMRLTRRGFAIYDEDAQKGDLFAMGEPVMMVRSREDGTRTNVRNWLECVRTRRQPHADVRAGVDGARTAHLANLAMRQGKAVERS
ncbi:MAG: Gfo/Idh/MocA family oxidoreductase [Bryobacterales bacterium]|nr:Gfo/Idh/MocA family oxidoreductase [Bryobacterales bacterium]